MNKKLMLYLDQWNNVYFANSVRELRKQINNGSSTVHKMYKNDKNGTTVYHIGYVIGGHWLTKYIPFSKVV